jgi:HEAT repeat protein
VAARLVEALRGDPDAGVRRIAAVALGELCAERADALPEGALEALRRAHGEPEDASLRRAAARALERLGAAGVARGGA